MLQKSRSKSEFDYDLEERMPKLRTEVVKNFPAAAGENQTCNLLIPCSSADCFRYKYYTKSQVYHSCTSYISTKQMVMA